MIERSANQAEYDIDKLTTFCQEMGDAMFKLVFSYIYKPETFDEYFRIPFEKKGFRDAIIANCGDARVSADDLTDKIIEAVGKKVPNVPNIEDFTIGLGRYFRAQIRIVQLQYHVLNGQEKLAQLAALELKDELIRIKEYLAAMATHQHSLILAGWKVALPGTSELREVQNKFEDECDKLINYIKDYLKPHVELTGSYHSAEAQVEISLQTPVSDKRKLKTLVAEVDEASPLSEDTEQQRLSWKKLYTHYDTFFEQKVESNRNKLRERMTTVAMQTELAIGEAKARLATIDTTVKPAVVEVVQQPTFNVSAVVAEVVQQPTFNVSAALAELVEKNTADTRETTPVTIESTTTGFVAQSFTNAGVMTRAEQFAALEERLATASSVPINSLIESSITEKPVELSLWQKCVLFFTGVINAISQFLGFTEPNEYDEPDAHDNIHQEIADTMLKFNVEQSYVEACQKPYQKDSHDSQTIENCLDGEPAPYSPDMNNISAIAREAKRLPTLSISLAKGPTTFAKTIEGIEKRISVKEQLHEKGKKQMKKLEMSLKIKSQ